MHTITLEKGLATFLNALSGKNRSGATIRAYQTDIQQFLSYLHETNVSIQTPADVEKVDIVEYLSSLAKRELTGIARARKVSDHRGSNSQAIDFESVKIYPIFTVKIENPGKSVVLENNNEHLKQLSAEGRPLFRALLSPRQEVGFGACLWAGPGEPRSAAVQSVRPFAW
jgi:site-specific recombinase XerD